jgi:hypothetical protein
MRTPLFTLRNLILIGLVAIAFVILSACGSAPAMTAEPAASTEESPDSPTANPPATPTSEFIIPVTGGGDETAPALLETRRLTLEYPTQIKVGSGSDVIRLALEVDDLGNITPTALVDGNVIEGEVIQIPNLYETHNVTAEAFYEVAGLEVEPSGATFRPLKPGERVTFTWSVRAQDVGTYGGTIWLFLNFENRSTGEKERKEIAAQIFDIKVVDFFGFSTNFVKSSGVVGSVLGVIVGFPFFKDIVKSLFERLSKSKRKASKAKKKT